jgi:hypothetical protein
MAGYGTASVMGAKANIVTVPELMRRRAPRATPMRHFASHPWFTNWLTHADWQASPGPLCHCWGRSCRGVRTSSVAHDVFPNIARVDKVEGIWPTDSRFLILAFLCPTSPSSLFNLEPFATFQAPATVCRNGIQPPVLSPPNRGRPQEVEAGARVAVAGVRREDAAWNHTAHWHGTWQFCVLFFVCPIRACVPVLLLPLHAVRVLWPSASDLSPHSITLVVIFVHLCEMYTCVRMSVRLHLLSPSP